MYTFMYIYLWKNPLERGKKTIIQSFPTAIFTHVWNFAMFSCPSASVRNSRFFKWNLMLKFLRNKLQLFKFGENRIGKRTVYMNTHMRLHEDLQAFTWILTWYYIKTYMRLREYLRDITWRPICIYVNTYVILHENLHSFTWILTCITWRPTCVYVNTYVILHEDLHAFTWILTWYYMKTYIHLREYLRDITWRPTSVYVNTYVILQEDLQAFTWILTWYYMKTYKRLHETYKRLR